MAIDNFIQNFLTIALIVFTVRHYRYKWRSKRLDRMHKEIELHQHFVNSMVRLNLDDNEFRMQLLLELDEFLPNVFEVKTADELIELLPEAGQLTINTKAKMKDFTERLAERHYKLLGECAPLGLGVLMFHYVTFKA